MRVLAVALVLLVAGCAAPARDDVVVVPSVLAHQAAGLVPGPAWGADISALDRPLRQQGAEPTLGVTSDGAIFVTGGNARIWRSTDGGATWQDRSGANRPVFDLDPYLHVDPVTDRIYAVPLNGLCSTIRWSDDGAETWQAPATSSSGGCGLGGHDHQSLTTAKPRNTPTTGYPRILYYTHATTSPDPATGGTRVVRSFDGGTTWETGQRIFPYDCHDGLNGAPASAPDGTVYVPKAGCNGLRIASTVNDGTTWTISDLDDVGIAGGAASPLNANAPLLANPSVAVDASGNAYAAWAGADGLLYAAPGVRATWSQPFRLTPPFITSTAFGAASAGSAGQLAVAYLGTDADTSQWVAPYPQHAPANTRWQLYVAVVEDATAPDPVVVTLVVTSDPVQVGCIWQAGQSATSQCRNLREYISAVWRGSLYVAYTDGCDACSSQSESTRQDLRVAVLTGGLFVK